MTRKTRLGSIIVLALVVRAALAWHLGTDLPVDHGQILALKNIMAGHGFSETVIQPDGGVAYLPTARDLPGHGIVILAMWYLTGTESLIPVQVLQILVDSLMVLLVFGIGRRLLSERIGLVGALLYSVYLPEAYLAVLARRDVWVTFGTITAVYLCVRYVERPRWRTIVAAGCALAWTAYFRSTILLFPLALAWTFRARLGWRRAILPTVALIVIVFSGLLPWGIRNYRVFNGRFLLTELNFYQSMWEGFGQFANPAGAVNSDELTEHQMRAAGYQGRFASFEYEAFLRPMVWRVVREHPGWYLGTVLRRIPRALIVNRVPWGILQQRSLEYHRFYQQRGEEMSLSDYTRQMARLNPGFLVTKVLDGLVLVLATAGFIALWRRQRATATLLLAIPVFFIGTLIPIRMEGRYLVPIHWVYLLGVAHAVLLLRERFRRRASA